MQHDQYEEEEEEAEQVSNRGEKKLKKEKSKKKARLRKETLGHWRESAGEYRWIIGVLSCGVSRMRKHQARLNLRLK